MEFLERWNRTVGDGELVPPQVVLANRNLFRRTKFALASSPLSRYFPTIFKQTHPLNIYAGFHAVQSGAGIKQTAAGGLVHSVRLQYAFLLARTRRWHRWRCCRHVCGLPVGHRQVKVRGGNSISSIGLRLVIDGSFPSVFRCYNLCRFPGVVHRK